MGVEAPIRKLGYVSIAKARELRSFRRIGILAGELTQLLFSRKLAWKVKSGLTTFRNPFSIVGKENSDVMIQREVKKSEGNVPQQCRYPPGVQTLYFFDERFTSQTMPQSVTDFYPIFREFFIKKPSKTILSKNQPRNYLSSKILRQKMPSVIHLFKEIFSS